MISVKFFRESLRPAFPRALHHFISFQTFSANDETRHAVTEPGLEHVHVLYCMIGMGMAFEPHVKITETDRCHSNVIQI